MKDPAFLFYPQDFLVGTMTMTFEDRGKYITLLSVMHQQGKLDEKTISFLVGLFSDSLRLKFKQDENGYFYNERLFTEIEKRSKFIESRTNNGKLGGRPKKEETYVKPKLKPKKKLSVNENVNENIVSFSEFLEYAKSKKSDVNIESLKFKYDAWVENGWKDGNDNKIKNWKSKLLQTLPYIKNDNGKNKSDYDEIPFDNSRFKHH